MSSEIVSAAPVQLVLDDAATSLVDSVLDSAKSPNTRRAYAQGLAALRDYSRKRPLSRQLLNRWRAAMQKAQLSSSTVNVRLSTARKLVEEALRAGAIDAASASDMLRVDGVPRRGSRHGNWLTLAESRKLLAVPDRSSLRGKRNYAILALLLGCALRREELAALPVSVIQRREGRWVLLDMEGKGGRTRTVAIPVWVKTAIDAWTAGGGISSGFLVRAITREGVVARSLTEDGIHKLVRNAGKAAGLPRLSPHDLRRTCAKLCRARGGDLEQIQLMLGHASIQTTERYLGSEQDLTNAVNDDLGL